MKRIFDESATVFKMVGAQREDPSARLRHSGFAVFLKTEDGGLLYHSLFKELLFLSEDESFAFERMDRTSELYTYFVSHYYFVPETFDELKTVEEIRSILFILQGEKELHSFTVLPTTDCNARCFYCYEAGCVKETMSLETASRVARYMIDRTKGKIRINWFGGEPLFASGAIDEIAGTLTKAKKDFSSKMISNGYLFDEELVKKAVSLWKLDHVQISLDGTKDVYNRRKAYIYPDPDPFGRVLRNIVLLSDAGVSVEVRLNTDAGNGEDLVSLVPILSEAFSGRENIRVYARMLYGEYENEASYRAYFRVKEAIEQAGLGGSNGLLRTIRTVRCMADSGTSAVILPDGRLTSCEHFNEVGEPWGSITDDSGFSSAVRRFRNYQKKEETCRDCPFLPDCLKPKPCPGTHTHCSPLEKKQREREIRESMKAEYKSWIKKEQPARAK